MFTHSIKRPEKPGILKRIFGGGHQPQQPLHALPYHHRQQQQQHPQQTTQRCPCGDRFAQFCNCDEERGVTPIERSVTETDNQRRLLGQFMDKTFYNRWMNNVVAMWPKGSICTFTMFPVILDRKEPPPWFIVDTHQEMRGLAVWDGHFREPKAVFLKPGGKVGERTWAAPSSLRPLLKSERELIVHLQDQQGQTEPNASVQEDDEGGGHGYAG